MTEIRRGKIKCFRLLILGIIFSYSLGELFAQEGANKQINPYHKHYADSLKTMEYKPVFPLLARRAYKRGYDIPLPYGISATYFYMRQNINIESTNIGFNGGEQVDLSSYLQYGDVINTTNIFTVRPDLWVLPFLNVYAIVGTGKSEVVVPLVQPATFSTTQDFNVRSAGFGVTLAGGMGPVFFTLDNNMAWAWLDVVEKPVPAYNLDTRIGHNFVSARHPERGVTIWLGAFYQSIRAQTVGHIAMSDVISSEEVADIKAQIDANPKLLPKVKDELDNMVDQLVGSTVDYSLDKKVAGPWNLIFGAQFQYNKHWQLRCELGTFGKRSQFMLNLNWRFQ